MIDRSIDWSNPKISGNTDLTKYRSSHRFLDFHYKWVQFRNQRLFSKIVLSTTSWEFPIFYHIATSKTWSEKFNQNFYDINWTHSRDWISTYSCLFIDQSTDFLLDFVLILRFFDFFIIIFFSSIHKRWYPIRISLI